VGVKVLFAPDYSASNPYQANLRDALAARDVAVESASWGRFVPLLVSILRSRDADVLHLHWLHEYFHARSRPVFAVRAALLVLQVALARLLGLRVVWTLHNLSAHEFPYPGAEGRLKRLFVTRLCDAVVAHCEAAVESAVDAYDLPESARKKMHVIPHGHYRDNYETEGSKAEAREALDVPGDATILLYFGMIRPYKNVPRLIETFADVGTADWRLVVAGRPQSDGTRAAVEAAAAGDDRVRTRLEYVPDAEVRRYMLAADAVVLPFRDTLTSGSAVLAMSYGRAFVAPRLGCLPELVGEDGGAVLYDPEDPDGLGGALRDLASRDLDAMGDRNRTRVTAFDWADIADRTVAVYRGTDGSGSERGD
jgi:glycosyltransferase involved in cell wall biosynthesis